MDLTTASKSPVVSVTIERWEGTIEELARDGKHTVATIAEADAILRRWSATVRPRGCDKCGVEVTWENGEVRGSRYDLERNDPCDIAEHLRRELSFYSGTWCPPHLTAAQHAVILARIPQERRDGMVECLRECAL